jgi:nitrate reductase NapAB chaperone NapD
MPVSSYVVRCAPPDQPAVRRDLTKLDGVIVGEATELGLPVVADTATTRAAEELGKSLQQVPGVKSAVLVYHNFEDVADEVAAPPQSFRTN